MTFRSLGRAARPRQAPGMIREIEKTGAVHLQVLPDPMNRNTCGKAGFLEASDCVRIKGWLSAPLANFL